MSDERRSTRFNVDANDGKENVSRCNFTEWNAPKDATEGKACESRDLTNTLATLFALTNKALLRTREALLLSRVQRAARKTFVTVTARNVITVNHRHRHRHQHQHRTDTDTDTDTDTVTVAVTGHRQTTKLVTVTLIYRITLSPPPPFSFQRSIVGVTLPFPFSLSPYSFFFFLFVAFCLDTEYRVRCAQAIACFS